MAPDTRMRTARSSLDRPADREDGERLHTGRSRNDQVACDLRLWLKDALLRLHAEAAGAAGALCAFGRRHARIAFPGYTHTRRAMPSSVGLWAAAYAAGCSSRSSAAGRVGARWTGSPLGSAAGYGVPLSLDRGASARALGFAGDGASRHGRAERPRQARGGGDRVVLQLAHDLAKLASDVIVLSARGVRVPLDRSRRSSPRARASCRTSGTRTCSS